MRALESPKLRNPVFYVLFLLLTIAVMLFFYINDKSSSKNGILFFGVMWVSFIWFAWYLVGKFVRRIELHDDSLLAVLQNGSKILLEFSDIKKVKFNKNIIYSQVKISIKSGCSFYVTSHIEGFDEFLKLLVVKGIYTQK
jgi:hypothetical protein